MTWGEAQEPTGNKASAIRAIKRALGIIEVLAATEGPARLSDIARATTFSKSTVHRILTTLVAQGYATKVGARYTLGPVFLRLAERPTSVSALQTVLMPFLVRLHIGTGGAASVGVLRNGQLRYSIAVHRWNYPDSPGEAVPLECTAVGRIFLAYTSAASSEIAPDLRALVAGATLEVCADFEATPSLMAELAMIRRRGVALGCMEHDHGHIEIAAPVFDSHNHVIAGLQVAGRSGELDRATAVKHVMRAASKASEFLTQWRSTGR
jgi:DNA-binding IclR family transcriptional regulator